MCSSDLVWGGLTSGGWAKAIWALLFPFSLANVSSWMLPPVPAGSRVAATLGVCCRALLRLAAMLLTVLLMAQMAAVSMDLLATQCLAPAGHCLTVVPTWVRTTAALRPAIGVVPLLAIVLVLGKVSHVNWAVRAQPAAAGAADRPRKLAHLPGAARIADPDAPALRTLHLIAALAVTALLALGGPAGPVAGGVAAVAWAVGAVLLVASLLGAVVLGDPTGARPDRMGQWLRAALSPVPRRIVLTVAVLAVAAVPVGMPRLGTTLSGTDPT